MTRARTACIAALVAAGLAVPAATSGAAVVSCHYSAGHETVTTTDDAGHEVVHHSIVIYRVCGHTAREVGSIPLS
jgi:hypothetical protein